MTEAKTQTSEQQTDDIGPPPILERADRKLYNMYYIVATLSKIDHYQKLVFKTDDMKSIGKLHNLVQWGESKFDGDNYLKVPVWSGKHDDMTYFKASLPSWELKNIYKIAELQGEPLRFKLKVNTYSFDNRMGIYFTIASMIKKN
jgi:hypothetical protein